MANYNTIDEDGFMSGNSFERKEKRKKDLAMLDGPATNVKIYDDLPGGQKRVLPDFGAGRVGKVRLKKKGRV